MAIINLDTGAISRKEGQEPQEPVASIPAEPVRKRIIDLDTGAFIEPATKEPSLETVPPPADVIIDKDIMARGLDIQQGGGVSNVGGRDISDSGAVPDNRLQPVGSKPSATDEIVGGFETVGRIASSMIAEPAAGIAGLITAPFVGVDDAVKNIDAVREFMTIDAETPEGQRNLGVIAGLVNKGVDLANIPTSGLVGIGEILTGQGIEQAAKSVERVQKEGLSSTLGQRVLEETGDPAIAAIAHSLPTAALEALGVKGLRSTRVARGERLSSNVAEAITQAAPDIKQIRTRMTDAYAELDKMGIKIAPRVYESFATKLHGKLIREGLDPTLTPKSNAAINRIIADIGQAKTPMELETMRKIAKNAANSIDKPDARLGAMIVSDIDKGLDSLSLSVGGKFKEARALAQRAFKSQAIVDMIESASHTASGMENGLRIEARKILKNPKKRRGFTVDELTALRRIEQGTTAANTAKFLGKFGISEGQATSMLGASIGVGGGGAIGSAFGPGGAAIGALTVPAIGQFAKRTAQRITLGNTKFADDLARAGKNGREVVAAYIKHTPANERRVTDLTDLLLQTDITAADVARLRGAKTPVQMFAADAMFFANEVNRKVKQAGSAALITQPKTDKEDN